MRQEWELHLTRFWQLLSFHPFPFSPHACTAVCHYVGRGSMSSLMTESLFVPQSPSNELKYNCDLNGVTSASYCGKKITFLHCHTAVEKELIEAHHSTICCGGRVQKKHITLQPVCTGIKHTVVVTFFTCYISWFTIHNSYTASPWTLLSARYIILRALGCNVRA